MSFKEIEHALSDAEAVQNYERVKSELAAVETAYQQYRETAASREQGYLSKIRDLEEKLSKSENFTIRYNKANYTPKVFAKLVSDEVEKEHRATIDREVDERWVAEKPGLVKEGAKKEILSYPKDCSQETRIAIESQGAKRADSILRNRDAWPQWFHAFYQQEVSLGVTKGLDDEFQRRLDAQATEEINRRVNYEWPKFITENVTPRFKGTLTELLLKLNQTIQINCDRCGTLYDVHIDPATIAALIKEPLIGIKCSNPSCKDLLFFPHSFPLTLGYVVYYITSLQSREQW